MIRYMPSEWMRCSFRSLTNFCDRLARASAAASGSDCSQRHARAVTQATHFLRKSGSVSRDLATAAIFLRRPVASLIEVETLGCCCGGTPQPPHHFDLFAVDIQSDDDARDIIRRAADALDGETLLLLANAALRVAGPMGLPHVVERAEAAA